MTAYTVYLEQLHAMLQGWSKEYQVYVPTAVEGGYFDFKPWREGVEIAFDYDLAYNTLKRYFLPPKEDLIVFDLASKTAEMVFDAPKQLLFGVHPYDIRGINQLDQIMEAGAPDQYYLHRRDATVVFGLTPMRVAETAFWSTMGAGEVDRGFDLFWTKTGPSTFLVEVGSMRGEKMLLAGGEITPASPGAREAARKAHLKIMDMARGNALNFDWKLIPRMLDKCWNSPLWQKKAELCLACGSCNMVCPTCYCFDIREEADELLQKGTRFREWDGCMLTSFALVAGEHNFRAKALERYRHRYMRKGKYIYDRIGELGCIGCGRCVRACTTNIANPREVFNTLWEASKHED